MDLLNKYESILNELSNDKKIDAIIIFGSYSTGRIKPLSDLDICIIPSKLCSKSESDDFLSYGTDELDISIFYNLPLSLQYKILIDGKIYSSKINLRYLKIKTSNKWFDFKPILNRIYIKKGLIPMY